MSAMPFTIGQVLGTLQFPGQRVWKDCIIRNISCTDISPTTVTVVDRASKRGGLAQVSHEELRQVLAKQAVPVSPSPSKVTIAFQLPNGTRMTYTHRGARADAYRLILSKYPEVTFLES